MSEKAMQTHELEHIVRRTDGMRLEFNGKVAYVWPYDGKQFVFVQRDGQTLDKAHVPEAEVYEWLRVRKDR